MTMVETETLLTRRAEIADEITQTIGRLGVLLRQEIDLRDQLRRTAEHDGSRTNPFETAVSISDAVCGELTRVGLAPHRADARLRLTSIVDSQHVRYRNQWATRAQVASKSA